MLNYEKTHEWNLTLEEIFFFEHRSIFFEKCSKHNISRSGRSSFVIDEETLLHEHPFLKSVKQIQNTIKKLTKKNLVLSAYIDGELIISSTTKAQEWYGDS